LLLFSLLKEGFMKESSMVRKIAFIGDYPPRKCGIATFTRNLLQAVAIRHSQSQCLAVSVNDRKSRYEYPDVVRFEIEEQDLSSYLRAADFLNINNVDIVCLQHEFGIFGGVAGEHVLALLRELRMPVVTTLHTVLREPGADQHRVMRELVALSTRLVVMAERGKQILHDLYQIPPAKIDLIPHGIPDVEFLDPEYFKGQFGLQGRPVLLTFGLLSPNKGIEYVLNALSQIVAEFPEVVYIVLGATHPNELRERGEAYRLSLESLTKKLKIEKNVIFCNQYVELESLKQFIGAADIYITPYLNEAQITSGTLAYTLGAGKAIISTPYWHATELLAKGRGVLVPFADAAATARATASLLGDDARRQIIRKNAYRFGREMVWSNVARQYMRSFIHATELSRESVARRILKLRDLTELKPSHLSQV
jgi:glycosyltransferase involved in cell wall biosynthesis